ncbi:MAG: zinc-binding dehydrogenase, partial [Gemmatimonadota bacterium]|nr:zinc-binding dehydrogenase [Gemmatimonadota bacterium]
MQTLTLDAEGNPEVSSGPVPACNDEDVLVKVRACVLSRRRVADNGADPPSTANGAHGAISRSFTGVIESSGRLVDSLGRGVDSLGRGDRVVACLTDGGFSEYRSVPASQAVKLPHGVSYEEGAIAGLMPTVLKGMERADVKGSTVFVCGLGTTGLLGTQVASISGAAAVIVSDLHAKRLQRAADIGADTLINASTEDVHRRVMDRTGGQGVDVCLECAGSGASFSQCAAVLRPGGKLVVLKANSHSVSIDMREWSERSLQLIMGHEQSFETPYLVDRGLKLVGIGAVRLRPLLTHVFPAHRAAEALELIDGHPDLAVEVALIWG